MEPLFYILMGLAALVGVYEGWKLPARRRLWLRLRIWWLTIQLQNEGPQEVEPVEVVVERQVESKPHPTITRAGALFLFEEDGLRCGFDPRWGHGAVVGKSGSGKGNALQLLTLLTLTEYKDEAELWVIDRKNGLDYAAFLKFPQFKLFRGRGDQTVIGLKAVETEMERRLELLFATGSRNLGEYNKKRSEPLPYLVLICDELADFENEHKKYVESFAALYRACGLVLIVATQHPLATHLSTTIQSNLNWRFVFKTTPKSALVATGVSSKAELEIDPSTGAIGKAVKIHNEEWSWVLVPELTSDWRDAIIESEVQDA
jgi:hypothetical protein